MEKIYPNHSVVLAVAIISSTIFWVITNQYQLLDEIDPTQNHSWFVASRFAVGFDRPRAAKLSLVIVACLFVPIWLICCISRSAIRIHFVSLELHRIEQRFTGGSLTKISDKRDELLPIENETMMKMEKLKEIRDDAPPIKNRRTEKSKISTLTNLTKSISDDRRVDGKRPVSVVTQLRQRLKISSPKETAMVIKEKEIFKQLPEAKKPKSPPKQTTKTTDTLKQHTSVSDDPSSMMLDKVSSDDLIFKSIE